MSRRKRLHGRRTARAARALVLAAAGLALAACSSAPAAQGGNTATTQGSAGHTTTTHPGTGATGTTTGNTGGNAATPTTSPPAGSPVVTPGGMTAIVSADSAANNLANSRLSIALQDGHEACLQDIADDITYTELRSSGVATSEPPFSSTSTVPFVPKQTSYPAYASSLVTEKSAGNPLSEAFFTFVKTSAAAPWKLDAAPNIMGATPPGYKVPPPKTAPGGFAEVVQASDGNGLVMAPGQVAAAAGGALSAEVSTGKFGSGFAAVYGAQGAGDPDQAYQYWVNQQGDSYKDIFSTTPPKVALPGVASPTCPLPAYACYRVAAPSSPLRSTRQ